MSLFTGKAILITNTRVDETGAQQAVWTKDTVLFTCKEYTQEDARAALATWFKHNKELFTHRGMTMIKYEITSRVVIFGADIEKSLVDVKI